jgi:ATP-dependent Zn protease
MRPNLTQSNIYLKNIVRKKNLKINNEINEKNNIFFNLIVILLFIFFILFLAYRYIYKKNINNKIQAE